MTSEGILDIVAYTFIWRLYYTLTEHSTCTGVL